MKNRYSVLATLSAVLLVSLVTIQMLPDEVASYKTREHFSPRAWAGAADIYLKLKGDPATGEYNEKDILRARRELQAFSTLKSGAVKFSWQDMGPDNVGGRTRAIVVDKNNTNLIYVGSVSGGLWKSTDAGLTWSRIPGFNDYNIIGSMAQLGNGMLIIGSGSKHEFSASGNGDSRFPGNGLYYTNDYQTFAHCQDDKGVLLKPTNANSASATWTRVNELVADPRNPNGVWVAYNGGLAYYDTQTKILKKAVGIGTGEAEEIASSADGLTLMASVGAKPYISRDGGETWQLSNVTTLSYGRAEFSIAQDNKNIIYASIARGNGLLLNIYASEDNGATWKVIMPQTTDPSRDPFAVAGQGQGTYDNVISAIPGKPREAILGGIRMWKVGLDISASTIGTNFGSGANYVHSDVHRFVWDKNGVLYIGCDGGIHKSLNKAATFTTNNKGYNVTQFYEMGYSGKDLVIGGAQDNGSQYIRKTAGNELAAISVLGGDGFDVEISNLNPNAIYASIYNGDIRRSSNNGTGMSVFYETSSICQVASDPAACSGLGGFYTTFKLYENPNDPNSRDSVNYTNNTGSTQLAGTEVEINSLTTAVKFKTTLPKDLQNGQTIKLQDKVTSIFAAGFTGTQGVWITRGGTKFSATRPQWWKVMNLASGEDTKCIEFTPDGSTMFVGTWSGRLYRISGLDKAWTRGTGNMDSVNTRQISSKQVYSISGALTGMSIDPRDPNHAVVTRGTYTAGTHVYETFNALASTPTWTSIQGNLPAFPVYDACIDKDNTEMITIATEFGVFVTMNGGTTWEEANDGAMGRTPVFGVKQQTFTNNSSITNSGFYYLSTHGRGIMKSEMFTVGLFENQARDERGVLKIFPNPVAYKTTVELDVKENKPTKIQIFNIQGTLVKEYNYSLTPGVKNIEITTEDLSNGTYIMTALNGNSKSVSKFIVAK